MTSDSTPDERHAPRLVAAATAAARRLRPFCADWPEERFGSLAYEAALVRLRGELLAEDVARLRREYEAHRAAYLARLGGRAG